MATVVGKCSVCSGRVIAGDPKRCENCGAIEAGAGDVIQMVPCRQFAPSYVPGPVWVTPKIEWYLQPQWIGSTVTNRIEVHGNGACAADVRAAFSSFIGDHAQ